MKILIDLQSLQGISRNRGIGRYSLSVARELILQANNHEVYLLFNANMLEMENINKLFEGLIPQHRIKIFKTPRVTSGHHDLEFWKLKAAEKIREHYISNLSPDITYITSIFEGWVEDIPISIGEFSNKGLTAVTLYDLIPFINSESYIKGHKASHFFYQKMQYLKKSQLLITISESGKKEAIDHLAFPSDKIINCSVGLDPKFKKYTIDREKISQLEISYGINKDFIFYIGALDFRKNVEGLIKAFILLPNRENLQLIIIISAEQAVTHNFNNFYKEKYKLKENELILISYVSEEILLTLYSTCSVFVFPSLHEGFGLPIIEAMACGAPTLASNISSMPEAIGCSEALFDPKNPQSIAEKIHKVLANKDFCNFLKNHGEQQIKKFTWHNTAKNILNSFEKLYEKNTQIKFWEYKRKKMAFISPLPPEQSGIADYSSKLIPELNCFYNIILITEQNDVSDLWLKSNFQIRNVKWLIKNINSFDILLYQLGNSSYHHYMIDLISIYPGIIVLHDFYISGLLDWISDFVPKKNSIFNQFLLYSHGISALVYQAAEGRIETHKKYPCNLLILKNAIGLIVHSQYSIDLAKTWYGMHSTKKFQLINHLAHENEKVSDQDKKLLKKKLGFKENDFIICCFGNLHPNKLNHRVIAACSNNLLKDDKLNLIFLGEKPYPDYHNTLIDLVDKYNLNKQIQILGFTHDQTFKNFFVVADIAIQLRTNSRGETSGCLLTCLSYGIPTIANAHGSINELPNNVIIKLPEKFLDSELSAAIDSLCYNIRVRTELSEKCVQYIKNNCHPAIIGQKFYETIEHFLKNNQVSETALIKDLIKSNSTHIKQQELLNFSEIIAANRQSPTSQQLLLDISYLIENSKNSKLNKISELIQQFVNTSSLNFRPEFIYFDKNKEKFFYAYEFIFGLLDLSLPAIKDRPVSVYENDIFVSIFPTIDDEKFLEIFTAKNIKVYLCIIEKIQCQKKFLYEIAEACIFFNNQDIYSLKSFLKENYIRRSKPLKFAIIDDVNSGNLSQNIFEIISDNEWQGKLKKTDIVTPRIFSLNRDIYINKIKYNFDGDKKYLSGAPEDFDAITLAIFQNFCKTNSYVLDLGANIGFTAIALADICTDGKIAAIEPLEPTFNFLKQNISRTNKKNISLHQFAVGNKNAEITMQATQDFLAGAFISDQYQADDKHFTYHVKVNLLDEVFEDFNFNKLDFIKMDLEGYEVHALEGGLKTLKKFKPTVLLEMNHWCLNVFHRISLPEFQERLRNIFPYIYAIEYPNFLDFTCRNNFYHIAHEHLTTTSKYFNLIAGFNQLEIVNALSKTMETLRKLQS